MRSEQARATWGPDHPDLRHCPDLRQCALTRHGEGWAPASALAAYVRGERVAEGLVGTIDRSGAPPQTTTAFRIASCTKSFTAAAVLLLRDKGLLDLEDDVRRYLPSLKVLGPVAGATGAVLTLHMLLSMSSGLPTDDPWADRQESMSREDFAQLISAGVRLVREPGAGYEYSNLGYAMLGQVVEKVSGLAYTTFVEQSLLQPLQLNGTAFSKAELLARIAGGSTAVTAVAAGYRKKADAAASLGLSGGAASWTELPMTGPGVFSAIGGLLSTLDDLGSWAAWLQEAFGGAEALSTSSDNHSADGSAESSDDNVLSRKTRREMQTLHQVSAPMEADGTVNGYGYGLVVQHHAMFGTVIAHSGGYPGFSAHMRWHAERGAAIVGYENATYSKVGIAVRAVLERHLAKTAAAPTVGGVARAVSSAAITARDGLQLVTPPRTPTAQQPPWPETVLAMTAVSGLVRSQSAPENVDLFSPNVALDMPWEERLAALGEALAVVGPLLETGAPTPPSRWITPASVEWELPARNGALVLRIQMTPVSPPRIQLLEISPLP